MILKNIRLCPSSLPAAIQSSRVMRTVYWFTFRKACRPALFFFCFLHHYTVHFRNFREKRGENFKVADVNHNSGNKQNVIYKNEKREGGKKGNFENFNNLNALCFCKGAPHKRYSNCRGPSYASMYYMPVFQKRKQREGPLRQNGMANHCP